MSDKRFISNIYRILKPDKKARISIKISNNISTDSSLKRKLHRWQPNKYMKCVQNHESLGKYKLQLQYYITTYTLEW